MVRETVSIIFTSAPNYNEHALKYFILYLNKIQSYYEFVFPQNKSPNIENYYYTEKHYETEQLFSYFEEHVKPNIDFENKTDYIINIITSRIGNNLFFVSRFDTKVVFITTDTWEKYFSPPSLFEYLLHCIFSSLLFLNKKLDIHSHSETRGCCFDYTYFKEDNRVDIVLGYICDKCKDKISKTISKKYLEEIMNIISRKWIGDITKIETAAYNLKKFFKFDINKDSGFNKTVFDKIKEPFLEIPSKTTLLVIGAIVGAIITKLFS